MEEFEKEKKEREGVFRYFELRTEYGPLYVYEKYEKEPDKADTFDKEMPVTREFFTNEEGIRGYCTLEFLDRTARFKTVEMLMNGQPSEHYMHELEPYEFLMKVAPYMETESDKEEKAKLVRTILESKARNIGNTTILSAQPEISKNAKNEVAKKLLKKHLI